MEDQQSINKLLNKFKKEYKKLIREQKSNADLSVAIIYLQNHYQQMNYALYLKEGFLIGSGVTESACKTLIKSRFCGPGMAWEESNTHLLLPMRGPVLTPNRWSQAWNYITKNAA